MELFHDNSLLLNYFCKKMPYRRCSPGFQIRLWKMYKMNYLAKLNWNFIQKFLSSIVFDDLIRKWYFFENFLTRAIMNLQWALNNFHTFSDCNSFFISVVILVRYFYSMWITCTYIKNFSLIDETQNNFFSIPQFQQNQKSGKSGSDLEWQISLMLYLNESHIRWDCISKRYFSFILFRT